VSGADQQNLLIYSNEKLSIGNLTSVPLVMKRVEHAAVSLLT